MLSPVSNVQHNLYFKNVNRFEENVVAEQANLRKRVYEKQNVLKVQIRGFFNSIINSPLEPGQKPI